MRGEGRRGYSAKRSSDPPVAYSAVKLQVGDLVRVVGVVDPFAPWGVSIRGKIVLSRNPGYKTVCWGRGRHEAKRRYIEPQMVNGHRRPVAGVPQQR